MISENGCITEGNIGFTECYCFHILHFETLVYFYSKTLFTSHSSSGWALSLSACWQFYVMTAAHEQHVMAAPWRMRNSSLVDVIQGFMYCVVCR